MNKTDAKILPTATFTQPKNRPRSLISRPGRRIKCSLALLAIVAFAFSLQAQTVRFKQPQVRVTIPPNYNGTVIVTNLVTVNSLGGNPVNLSLSGLPSGATAILRDTNGFALTSTLITTNLWIQLNLTNVAKGLYTLRLDGTGGAANNLLFGLQVGIIWNGSTNAAVDGAGLWSDASKWQGGVPGASDDVIFNDQGGQTNSSTSASNLVISSIISSDTTIASLRFAQVGSATRTHNIQINPGTKLTITGTNGFSFLRDTIADSGYGNNVNPLVVAVFGTNASLIVTNRNANFALLNDGSGNNARSTLDLSSVDNFSATVASLPLGDFYGWPNYSSEQGNGNNGIPRRFLPDTFLAKTNVITALFADPFNYTNEYSRGTACAT